MSPLLLRRYRLRHPKPTEPQRVSTDLEKMVGREWFEHSTKGFRFAWLSPLPGLCLHHCLRFRWVPSSLYTFNVISHKAWLGVAIYQKILRFRRIWHHSHLGFPSKVHKIYESSALTNWANAPNQWNCNWLNLTKLNWIGLKSRKVSFPSYQSSSCANPTITLPLCHHHSKDRPKEHLTLGQSIWLWVMEVHGHPVRSDLSWPCC